MRSKSWLPLSRAVGSKSLAVISTSATWFKPIIRVFSVRRSPGRIGRRNRVCSVASGPRQSDDQAIDVRVARLIRNRSISMISRSPSNLAGGADGGGTHPHLARETQQLSLRRFDARAADILPGHLALAFHGQVIEALGADDLLPGFDLGLRSSYGRTRSACLAGSRCPRVSAARWTEQLRRQRPRRGADRGRPAETWRSRADLAARRPRPVARSIARMRFMETLPSE